MYIDGFIKIEEGILLTSECLNQKFDIEINGAKGFLISPSLPEKPKDNKIVGAVLSHPKSHIKFNEFEWGHVNSWPDCDSEVSRFIIEFQYNNKKDFNKIKIKIDLGIEDWIIRFRENLFAVEYNIDVPKVWIENNLNNKCGFYYMKEKGKQTDRIQFSKMDQVNVIIDSAIDINDFSLILDVTSQNKRLKLEFQLLKDAQSALLTGNYRKSILDCSSAFELALTNAIKKDLKINEDLINEILKMNNSISKKRNLINFTQYKLPKHNYQKDVEEVRNKAIHIGSTPTELEARNAYKIVKEVIYLLSDYKFE